MTAISPCATSYADGHGFATNETWLDRSSNNNTLLIDFNWLTCVFKTNKINGLPAVSFGGPDGSGNCGWLASQWDVSATSWRIFAVYQSQSTSGLQGLVGGNTLTMTPGTFKYVQNYVITTARQHGIHKTNVADVGEGTATADTNWHQLNVYFSNSADQNTFVARLDRAADGSSTPGITVNTGDGGLKEMGIIKANGIYGDPAIGRLAEILIYAGTGTLLSAGDVTTNETYLNCRYGL